MGFWDMFKKGTVVKEPPYTPPVQPPKVATIIGTVVERGTSNNLSDVDIKIYDGQRLRYQAKTDTNGNFRIDVLEGIYTFVANKTGYRTGEVLRETKTGIPVLILLVKV